jgi:hypothetical protein
VQPPAPGRVKPFTFTLSQLTAGPPRTIEGAPQLFDATGRVADERTEERAVIIPSMTANDLGALVNFLASSMTNELVITSPGFRCEAGRVRGKPSQSTC